MEFLKKIDNDIWIVDGDSVPWFGFPYTTRMTIVRLKGGELWVHSPGQIVDEMMDEINALGQVSYLVSSNKIHHLFIGDWIKAYPKALSYASPGLKEKRTDISFDNDLTDAPEQEWQDEIDQLIFKGSSAMEEVVFFHKKSKTLVLTDLIENFHPEYFSGYKKLIAKMTGIISPHGKTPIDWRFTFMFGKAKARESLLKMLAWQAEKIIISHGECILDNAFDFLDKSFKWVGLKNKSNK